MSNWTNSQVQDVWDKGSPIRGKNPNLYRKDAHGNEIYRAAYGRDGPMGWEVDHIKPRLKGGLNSLENLQPLQTRANR